MKAARLRTGRTHFIYDGTVTYCSRYLIDLPVVQELEAAALPPDEPMCVPCAEIVRSELAPEAVPRITLPPGRGLLRKTGPLYHGFSPKHGEILPYDD